MSRVLRHVVLPNNEFITPRALTRPRLCYNATCAPIDVRVGSMSYAYRDGFLIPFFASPILSSLPVLSDLPTIFYPVISPSSTPLLSVFYPDLHSHESILPLRMTYVEFFHRMLLALLVNLPIYMRRDISI